MAYIFPSNWTREGRNHLNYMSKQLDAVDEALGEVNLFSDTVDNTSYKIGAELENCEINGSNGSGHIKYMSLFLGAGFPGRRLDGVDFEFGQNQMLYIDVTDSPLKLYKGNEVPISAGYYGKGAFYNDTKILLLGNYQGAWIGALSSHFVASARGGGREATGHPKLMAQKVDDGHYVYVRSSNNKARYARYHIKSVNIPYANGDDKSNVNVHTIDSIMNCYISTIDGSIRESQLLATVGAWDIAMRESGSSDGSGGIAHGDEVEHYFNVYVDGVLITDIDTKLTEYQRIEFVAASTVYRDSQTHSDLTPLAQHFKSFYFDADRPGEMMLDSKVIMLRDATLLYAYLSMAPISKTYTNKAISDIDLEVNDLTQTSPIHNWRPNIKRISVWGTNVHVRAEIMDMLSPGTPVSKVEEVSYNKIYFNSITNGESVKNGDVLHTKTRFTIDLR